MEVIKAIRTRQSVRKYKREKPDYRQIIEAIHSAQYAPMAGKFFSLYFLIINEESIIKQIAELSEQNFIKDAKWTVIVISDPSNTEYFVGNESKFQHQQAGAAIQNFMLHLTELGLSTCWVGEFPHEKIRKLLKIDEGYEIEGIFPIGYPKEKLKEKKPKGDIYRLLAFNSWTNERLKKQEFIEGRGPEGY